MLGLLFKGPCGADRKGLGILFPLVIGACLLWSGKSSAVPCFDQAIPLMNVGITAYPDCTETDVVYFVPQNLKIAEHILTGEKSFNWKLDAGGTGAKVLMKTRLFNDQGRIVQALIDLKKVKPLRYRIRPFEMREVQFTGFGDEGLVTQKMLASSGFSDAFFSILLTLDQTGVNLWKDAADFGLWSLEPATITYKLAGKSSGMDDLRQQTHQVEIDSLPACVILGTTCSVQENESRIIPNGRAYGRLQFHLQYVSCPDFRGNELTEPVRAAFDDASMTPDEQWIAYQAALEGFRTERDKLKEECKPTLDRLDGEAWFTDFSNINRITCASLHLWTYDRIITGQQDRPDNWKSGVRGSYDKLMASCTVPTGYNCNELNQGRICHGTLQSAQSVCFGATFMREKLGATTGSCLFQVMAQNNVGSWVQTGLKKIAVDAAKTTDTCVSTSRTLASDANYLAVIDCR